MDLDPYAKQSEHLLTIAGLAALLYKIVVRPIYLWFKGMKLLLEKMEHVVDAVASLEKQFSVLEAKINSCPYHQYDLNKEKD